MPSDLEPTIVRLTEEWDELIDLCDELTDDQWATPTALPGWTVKDCISHVVGIELMLLGEAPPAVEVSHLAHVGDDPIAAAIESWVEARRDVPGSDVLGELRSVSIRRVAALRRLSAQEWEAIGPSPVGQVSMRTFMEVRIFDCWMHEQDIRRALGRPGHLEGDVVEVALGRIMGALGVIVGKRAGAPDGSSVVLDVVGPSQRSIAVVVDGRAKVVDVVPDDPTARVRLSLEALAALGGGRRSPHEAIASGEVELVGDVELARRVVQSLPFTP